MCLPSRCLVIHVTILNCSILLHYVELTSRFALLPSMRWPGDTLYPQKLALTSPTSGGRSVGIVRLRNKSTEFFFWVQRRSIFDQLFSVYWRYIFRPNRPSSGVEAVVIKESAAHCNAVSFLSCGSSDSWVCGLVRCCYARVCLMVLVRGLWAVLSWWPTAIQQTSVATETFESIIGWGIMLQAGRSRVAFPLR
jgi:hypothetical protein